jgi:hypothetical protein
MICSVQVGYFTIETKEVACIGYNGFIFSQSYSGEKRNLLYSIRAVSFV